MSTKDMDKVRAEAKDQGSDAGIERHGDDIIVDEDTVTDMTPLQVLLSAKPVRQQRKLVVRKRDGLQQDLTITVNSLTDAQFKAIGEEAETPVDRANRSARRSGKAEKETDNNLFLRLIVANAIGDPNLGSPEVLAAHGAVTAEQVVARVFLPGEVARVAEEVMDLSGWSDDAVEVAKN